MFVSQAHFVICDTVHAELRLRMQNYLETLNMFRNCFENNDETLTMETCVTKLIDAYKGDIDILQFKEGLIRFLEYAREKGVESVYDNN